MDTRDIGATAGDGRLVEQSDPKTLNAEELEQLANIEKLPGILMDKILAELRDRDLQNLSRASKTIHRLTSREISRREEIMLRKKMKHDFFANISEGNRNNISERNRNIPERCLYGLGIAQEEVNRMMAEYMNHPCIKNTSEFFLWLSETYPDTLKDYNIDILSVLVYTTDTHNVEGQKDMVRRCFRVLRLNLTDEILDDIIRSCPDRHRALYLAEFICSRYPSQSAPIRAGIDSLCIRVFLELPKIQDKDLKVICNILKLGSVDEIRSVLGDKIHGGIIGTWLHNNHSQKLKAIDPDLAFAVGKVVAIRKLSKDSWLNLGRSMNIPANPRDELDFSRLNMKGMIWHARPLGQHIYMYHHLLIELLNNDSPFISEDDICDAINSIMTGSMSISNSINPSYDEGTELKTELGRSLYDRSIELITKGNIPYEKCGTFIKAVYLSVTNPRTLKDGLSAHRNEDKKIDYLKLIIEYCEFLQRNNKFCFMTGFDHSNFQKTAKLIDDVCSRARNSLQTLKDSKVSTRPNPTRQGEPDSNTRTTSAQDVRSAGPGSAFLGALRSFANIFSSSPSMASLAESSTSVTRSGSVNVHPIDPYPTSSDRHLFSNPRFSNEQAARGATSVLPHVASEQERRNAHHLGTQGRAGDENGQSRAQRESDRSMQRQWDSRGAAGPRL